MNDPLTALAAKHWSGSQVCARWPRRRVSATRAAVPDAARVPLTPPLLHLPSSPHRDPIQAAGKGAKRPAFDPSVVEKIYATELGGGKEVAPDRAMLLEFSGYLESYLWPNFDAATATRAHVMSIVLVR